MRDRLYALFEIVAWPALGWCVVEVGVRLATGALSGGAMTVATGMAACATVVASRLRRHALVAAPGQNRER